MSDQTENAKPIALVIEDNPDQNLVFTMALNKAGFSTESIYNGIDAQQRLKEVVPDIVILDLHLPDVDGNLILGQIRSERRLSKVNVVLATADAAFADALEPQVELVLLKPVSFSQLSDLASRFNPKRTTGSLRRPNND